MPSGPLPKPAGRRARRNATVAMRTLPAAGRAKRNAPPWPLPPDPRATTILPLLAEDIEALIVKVVAETDGRKRRSLTKRLAEARRYHASLSYEIETVAKAERELWKALWRTPMAVEWEKLRWTREVAAYARHKAKAELGDIDEAKRALALSDRLGLTPWSLQRLRWEVGAATAATGPGLASVTTLPPAAVADAVADFA